MLLHGGDTNQHRRINDTAGWDAQEGLKHTRGRRRLPQRWQAVEDAEAWAAYNLGRLAEASRLWTLSESRRAKRLGYIFERSLLIGEEPA